MQLASDLRLQIFALAIGVVLLSASLIGAALFLFRRKTGDRSLLFFAIFSLLYAVRLIFRQSFFRLLVPASPQFWSYSESLIDNFIVIPLTLFLIETVQDSWRKLLRWLLVGQIAFGMVRFLTHSLHIAQRPTEVVNHILVVLYCALLIVYPFSFRSGQKLPREFKVAYAGLLIHFGSRIVEQKLPCDVAADRFAVIE